MLLSLNPHFTLCPSCFCVLCGSSQSPFLLISALLRTRCSRCLGGQSCLDRVGVEGPAQPSNPAYFDRGSFFRVAGAGVRASPGTLVRTLAKSATIAIRQSKVNHSGASAKPSAPATRRLLRARLFSVRGSIRGLQPERNKKARPRQGLHRAVLDQGRVVRTFYDSMFEEEYHSDF